MKRTQIFVSIGAIVITVSIGSLYNLAYAQGASNITADATFKPVAERLQRRILSRFGESVTLDEALDAVVERRTFYARSVAVSFRDEKTASEISTWNVSLGSYPEWMRFDLKPRPRFSLDTELIRSSVAITPPDGLSIPSFATVLEVSEDGKTKRAVIEGTVADGQTYDTSEIAASVIDALTSDKTVIQLAVTSVKGAVLYNDGVQTYSLTELGVGRSEFASSPLGRKKNVRKAMNEKANGIFIPEGSTFSFNATLNGPITYSNGWYESLIIVNGRDLEPAPGGGICQASTTVFRAAVAAGLPVTFRRSHSLYVTYYKQYGVGLDAAVFPGKQDMLFENDTQGPMILLGMTDEQDNAYSTIYGIDDNRSVVLDGPYFGYTHKEPVMGKTLGNNQVGWIQRVTKADGTTRDQLLVAQYLQLPKSVAMEFERRLHGAAGLVEDAM